MRRGWRKYSKDTLSTSLSNIEWRLGVEGVQQYWNIFENLLINVVDKLAPLTLFVDDRTKDSKCPNGVINALNVRSRLLKRQNKKPTTDLKQRIVYL